MTAFWIIAAAIAFTAPLFIALPLLRSRPSSKVAGADLALEVSVYRDQLSELDEERRSGRLSDDQYELARDELESRMLDEVPATGARVAAPVAETALRRRRVTALAASIAVPAFALLMYLALGNPGALGPQQSDAPHGLGQQQMDAMIGRLAARLEKNPQDAKGWAMLARALTVLGRFGEASAAYGKSVALFPDDAQLLADYADALAMSQGGQLSGEPEQLVERALRADPNNAKALALAGTVSFDKHDFALAVKHWERLRSLIPPDSEFGKSIQGSIDEAKSLLLAQGTKRAAAEVQAGTQASARR